MSADAEQSAGLTIAPPDRAPGVYALLLLLKRGASVTIGSLGVVELERGIYIYIGSARGPGGVQRRVERHARRIKRVRWHIDYLTTMSDVEIVAVVHATASEDVEERLAAALSGAPCIEQSARGFGSSDRRSVTHLLLCRCGEECADEVAKVMRSLGLEPRLWRPAQIHKG